MKLMKCLCIKIPDFTAKPHFMLFLDSSLQGGNTQAAESLQVSQSHSGRDNTLPALDGRDNQPLKPADGGVGGCV